MNKWIAIGIVVAALAGLGVLIAQRAGKVQEARERQAEPLALPPPAVKVAPAVARDFVDELEVGGEVRAKRTVYVYAKVGGRLEELAVGLGDKVVAGQMLAKVEDNDLGWRERQGVAGERAAAAAVRQAASQVGVAKTEYERAKTLREAGVLPEADLVRVEGQYEVAQSALAAARAQVEVARAGSGLAKEARSWTVIESPIDGVVTRLMTELGATVGGQPPQPLMEVQDQSKLEIRVDVPPLALDAVAVGRPIEFAVSGRPGRRFGATVKAVGRALDPATRRVQVELSVPGAVVDEGVLPHMLVTVFIETSVHSGIVAAPREAVVMMAEGPAVFVVRDGKAWRLAPEMALADRTHVPVPELAVGEEVVVAGQDKLADGMEVRISAPGGTAAGAGPEMGP